MTTRAERAAQDALEVLENLHREVHKVHTYGCLTCDALWELRLFLDEVVGTA